MNSKIKIIRPSYNLKLIKEQNEISILLICYNQEKLH
jgi:hypothetical protein